MTKKNLIIFVVGIVIIIAFSFAFLKFKEEKLFVKLVVKDRSEKEINDLTKIEIEGGGCDDITEKNALCLALASEDISYCDDEDCRSDYYWMYAVYKNDKSICKKIEDNTWYWICENLFSEKNICEGRVEPHSEDFCRWSSKDFDCTASSDKTEEMICSERKNFLNILKTKNVEDCEKLKEKEKINMCKAVLEKNSAYCVEIQKIKCYDDAYFDLASRNPGLKFCDKIDDLDYQKECEEKKDALQDFYDSINSKDKALCKKIKDENIKKACLSVFSLDPEMCASTRDGTEKFLCMTLIAANKKDASLCQKLDNTELREACESIKMPMERGEAIKRIFVG